MERKFRLAYAYVVCFFCVATGGTYAALSAYHITEIAFTDQVHPETLRANLNYKKAMEKHDEAMKIYENLKSQPRKDGIVAGVSPYPFAEPAYPLNYGTTKQTQEKAIRELYPSFTKVIFSIIIFLAHWRITTREKSNDRP
ncbi:MAG: hypothetical protein JKY88_18705 [Pseudomonadales bacterium]|nr:hypothetical protein [Pseudomonadales bacterium]